MVFEYLLQGLYNLFWDLINSIIKPIYDLINGIVTLIYTLLSDIFDFLQAIYNLLSAILGFTNGLLYPLMSLNPYALVVFGLIIMCISVVFFRKIWNIIADLEIFGWKLPRL